MVPANEKGDCLLELYSKAAHDIESNNDSEDRINIQTGQASEFDTSQYNQFVPAASCTN